MDKLQRVFCKQVERNHMEKIGMYVVWNNDNGGLMQKCELRYS